uniref:Uncharacterized protein n=1 Tax=viral metagenome TaxID=1070528 RepID=A0A6C0AT25_9ZZZZ
MATVVPEVDSGIVQYDDTSQQFRVTSGDGDPVAANGVQDFYLPPAATLHYVLVGAGRNPSAQGGGDGGEVVAGSFTNPNMDKELVMRVTTDAQSSLLIDRTNSSIVAVANRSAAEAPNDPVGGAGNGGANPPSGADPGAGVSVNLWGTTPTVFGAGGAGDGGTPVAAPRAAGFGGNTSGLGDSGEGTVAYAWIDHPPLVLRDATTVSVLRRQGVFDGLLTDMPMIGTQVPESGLTFTGQPSPQTRLETYRAPIPILDVAGVRYVTTAAPTGVDLLNIDAITRFDACVHECVSPPGYTIVLMRVGDVSSISSISLTFEGSPTTLVSPQPFSTSTFLNVAEFSWLQPPQPDVFYRFVFSGTGRLQSAATNTAVDVLREPLGEHVIVTRDGVLPTGQRTEQLSVMYTGTALETRGGGTISGLSLTDQPITENLRLASILGATPTATVDIMPIGAFFPAQSNDTGGAVVVSGVRNSQGVMEWFDSYDHVHFQDDGALVPVPNVPTGGSSFFRAPQGPGVTMRFSDPEDGTPIELSTNPAAAPRRVISSSGRWSFSGAANLIANQLAFLPDGLGVPLRARDVDGASAGRLDLEASYLDTLPRVGGNPPATLARPDAYGALLRDPAELTASLRVYDALYGATPVAVVDTDTIIFTHNDNAVLQYTYTGSAGVVTAANADTLSEAMPPGTPFFVLPGRVAVVSAAGGISVDDFEFVMRGTDVSPRVVAAGDTAVLQPARGVYTVVSAAQQPTGLLHPEVDLEDNAINAAPLGMSYVEASDLLAPDAGDDRLVTTAEPSAFRLPQAPTEGATREALTRTADQQRVVVVNDATVVQVTGVTVVDGFVYGFFMAYPAQTGDLPVDPVDPVDPGIACALLRVPTVRKYGVPPSALQLLGITVVPLPTQGMLADFAGRRQRIPLAAHAALAWMASNPADVMGVDIAFAAINGCPAPLLAALRLLDEPVAELAFETARVCFGYDVPPFDAAQVGV